MTENTTPASTPETYRSVEVMRTGPGSFAAVNARGGRIAVGSGRTADFTPGELLLAAIAGCASIDVDMITGKRAEPTQLTAVGSGDKVREGARSLFRNLAVEFTAVFPQGDAGDAARAVLADAIAMSAERLCTVANTVSAGGTVAMREKP